MKRITAAIVLSLGLMWAGLAAAECRAADYHVSSSAGSDAAGDGSPAKPFATIAKARSLCRDGAGDRVLLRRGDTFAGDQVWNRSGAADAPAGLGAWGDGPRPRIAGKLLVSGVRHVLIAGIEIVDPRRDFTAAASFAFDGRDPVGLDLRTGGVSERISIEDCRVAYWAWNVAAQPTGTAGRISDVTLRACEIVGAWGRAYNAGQGVYAAGVDGLVIDGCRIEGNGLCRHPSAPVECREATVYRHGLYLDRGNRRVVVRGNAILGNASYGCQSRSDDTRIEGNLFAGNAIAAMTAGQRGDFVGNLVVAGGAHTASQNGSATGHGAGGYQHHSLAGEIAGNVFVDPGQAIAGLSYALPALSMSRRGDYTPAGTVAGTFADNVVYAWRGGEWQTAAGRLDRTTNPEPTGAPRLLAPATMPTTRPDAAALPAADFVIPAGASRVVIEVER